MESFSPELLDSLARVYARAAVELYLAHGTDVIADSKHNRQYIDVDMNLQSRKSSQPRCINAKQAPRT